MSFITSKFQEIVLSGFRGVVLTRKTGLTDWLADWLTEGRVKNIIPSATRWSAEIFDFIIFRVEQTIWHSTAKINKTKFKILRGEYQMKPENYLPKAYGWKKLSSIFKISGKKNKMIEEQLIFLRNTFFVSLKRLRILLFTEKMGNLKSAWLRQWPKQSKTSNWLMFWFVIKLSG